MRRNHIRIRRLTIQVEDKPDATTSEFMTIGKAERKPKESRKKAVDFAGMNFEFRYQFTDGLAALEAPNGGPGFELSS